MLGARSREHAMNARSERPPRIRSGVSSIVLWVWLTIARPTKRPAPAQEQFRVTRRPYAQPPPPPCGHPQCADPLMRIYCPQRPTQPPQAQRNQNVSRHNGAPAPGGRRPRRRMDRPIGRPTAPQERAALRRNRRHRRHPRTAHPMAILWPTVLTAAKIILQAATWWRHGK
jgi:hypothetical protein